MIGLMMRIKQYLNNKIVKNAGWIIIGKVIHMVLSFVIGLITARYLGPSNYGLINYASAYTTFFTAFCTLGINSVILKDFVDHPDQEGTTIGTTIILRLISSVLSVGVICSLVSIIDYGESLTLLVVFLYTISLIFQVFDTFHQWFQSKYLSKYYAIATLISYLIASSYKIILLIFHADVAWFAVSNSIDFLIVAVVLFLFYRKCKGPRLSFSWAKGKSLLRVSCSYILSGLMVAIYGATDKLMLKQMLDESAVGYYSLAVSISTVWAFVLSAIIESMKPQVMEYYQTDKSKYVQTNKRMYALVFYIAIAASAIICLISPIFVEIVYGKSYLPSVMPLRIVVWYVAFSYLGVARDAWVVCEGKQKYLKFLYLGSSLLNVILNYIMIPVLGASGAALASLITQISTIFIFPLMFKAYRVNVSMMIEAIMLKGILRKK